MIEKFLNDLDAFLSASPSISDIDIVRRDIRDTGLEKIAIYRYRLQLENGSMIELTERMIEEGTSLKTTKYRYHWQDASGNLIKRWDNAPHHPEIHTHPHHVHEGSESHVKPYTPISVFQILDFILSSEDET